MASTSARSRCTRRFAPSEVKRRPLAVRPQYGRRGSSRSSAITYGRLCRNDREKRLVQTQRQRPVRRRSRPRRRAPPGSAKPPPLTSGFGSSMLATTRAIPASTMRSTQGRCAPCDSTARACSRASRPGAGTRRVESVDLGVRLSCPL